MSDRALNVLRAIDRALDIRDRHPTLFAAQMRADRSVLSLIRAAENYKRAKQEPVGGRADHDEVERVDAETEEAFAERNGERHERRRRKQLDWLRSFRARTPLEVRLRIAIDSIKARSTVPAAEVGKGSPSSNSTGLPPKQQTADLTEGERLLRPAVLWFESLADELAGLSSHREIAAMDAQEKDSLIGGLVGWTPAEIEAAYGGLLGSVRTVEKKRREWHLTVRDGRPLTDRPDG